jgi:hypothetical protein
MRKLAFLIIVFQLCSCATNKKLLQKTEILNEKVKFYSLAEKGNKTKIKKIYADVDSSGYKSFYSFYPNSLLVTSERSPQTMITLVFDDAEGYKPFTTFDSLIVRQANKLFASRGLDSFMVRSGATGFQEVIYFLHGWPKGRKLQPL